MTVVRNRFREQVMPRGSRALQCAAVLLTFTLLGGCARMRATVDYDQTVDFAHLQRYAWLPDPPGPRSDPRVHNDLIDARVRGAVDRILAARGYEQVPEADAEFFVAYYLLLESRLDVRTVGSGLGDNSRDWWTTSTGAQTNVTQYERGTLLLDVLEPQDRRLIWRGSTNARVRRSMSVDKRNRLINEAVDTILSRFPPQ
jgi:hypothetical protein